MKKVGLFLTALTISILSNAAEFKLAEPLQCFFDGSANMKVINIGKMQGNLRSIEIDFKSRKQMSCIKNLTVLDCVFESGFFRMNKSFKLDLSSALLVTNLDDSPRNYLVQGLLGSKKISCTQQAK